MFYQREKWETHIRLRAPDHTKFGGAFDRFGDFSYVNYKYSPWTSDCNRFLFTKFTRPFTKVSKSRPDCLRKQVAAALKCEFTAEKGESRGGGGGNTRTPN